MSMEARGYIRATPLVSTEQGTTGAYVGQREHWLFAMAPCCESVLAYDGGLKSWICARCKASFPEVSTITSAGYKVVDSTYGKLRMQRWISNVMGVEFTDVHVTVTDG